ncbi:MAG TPA: hypothetical protein VJ949_10855, partial [Cryomorphaceae bacterium]|nr:hypothetical protein [Cryomorphaceae bacterium]
METLITVLIESVPTLILAGLILYIFHEYMNFVNERDKRLAILNSKTKPAESRTVAPVRSDD